MKIKEIMEAKYSSFQTDDSLDRILETFSQKGISSAPVFAKDEFIGIISYASIARLFTHGRFAGVKDERKMNAAVLAKKPPFTIPQDAQVESVLGKLVATQDCIPVMNGSRLAGVVWPRQVIEFYLSERAKVVSAEAGKAGLKARKQEEGDATSIDRMLEIITRDGTTTPKKAARELGITESTAEDLAKLLDKHKLAEINYSFLTGMVIRRIEHGR